MRSIMYLFSKQKHGKLSSLIFWAKNTCLLKTINGGTLSISSDDNLGAIPDEKENQNKEPDSTSYQDS